ncbi:MAG: SprB repeat-containing protein, partial [Flavobacteriales bacterium]|nr:SprB repeat-containing protein [Flavobacteriales bacterium]
MYRKIAILSVLLSSFSLFGQQPTSFTTVVGFSDDGNCNYTNIAGGGWNNNMLTSSNFIAANTDGEVSYTVASTSDKLAFGLSVANASIKVKDITYRMLLGNKLSIWEDNRMKGNFGNLAVGDELTIARVGSEIQFIKNGNIILALTTDPTLTLYTKVSAQSANLTVSCDDFSGDYYEDMVLSYEVTKAKCLSDELGAINLTVTKGVPPYTYSWSSGETTEDVIDKDIGQYTVTITDFVGFQISETVDVLTCIAWQNIQEGLTCDEDYIRPDAWLKYFGGNTNEYPGELLKTTDGGYIISVNVSAGSDLPGHHGGNDAWIVKLDIDGNVEWSKMLGGSGNENLFHLA